MAIIKCPECGRQISDKAPTCPSCGVEIAGKITKCPNCGEVYFNYLEMCPNCQTPQSDIGRWQGSITPTPSAPEQLIHSRWNQLQYSSQQDRTMQASRTSTTRNL